MKMTDCERMDLALQSPVNASADLSLRRFRSLIENATDIIVILDQEGIFRYASPSAERVLGYRQEDVEGRSAVELVHPEDISIILQVLERAIRHPRISQSAVEYRVRHRDGSWRLFEAVATSLLDDPAIGGVVVNCHDITKRKQAEEALRQQAEQERLISGLAQLSAGITHRIRKSLNLEDVLNTTVSEVRQFLRANRVVIYRCTPTGDRIVTAESVETGYPSLLGLHLFDRHFQQRAASYRQGQAMVIDTITQVADHEDLQMFMHRWQIQAILAVPILHGEALWGTLVAHQCSQPRRWELYEVGLLDQLAGQVAIAIQQSELYAQVRRLNTNLEEQVQDRTVQLRQALDYEATLKRITDSVRDSLDEDQILQNVVKELAMGLDVAACDAGIYDLERQTSTVRYEYIRHSVPSAKGTVVQMQAHPDLYTQLLQAQHFQFCRNFQPSMRPLQYEHTAFICPIVDDQGVMGDLWLFRSCHQVFSELDIRLVQQVANQCAIAIRQARLYQATQAQVKALEKLNLLKDDFLSTVSHELRTPMSNMKMAIHMLRRNITSPERQRQYLDILQAECIREIELINDLLDLQRLEASSYSLSPVSINLRESVQALIQPFHTRTQERKQILTLHVSTRLARLTTDRSTLERILTELLNNACKYTPPGGEIDLSVTQASPADQQNSVVFLVRNHAAISEEELSRVFDKFYRVPNGDRWKQGGTGLGLALVQRLVQELGGSIQVASENGWTTFTVKLANLI
jgi:PAS domain S-box-containing protein